MTFALHPSLSKLAEAFHRYPVSCGYHEITTHLASFLVCGSKAFMANPAQTGFNQKAANRWTARIVPIVLVAIVGYVTWVIIVLVCGQ